MVFRHLLHAKHDTADPGVITQARTYDVLGAVAFGGRRRRFYSRLVRLAGIRPGDRVLDIGCGPGNLTALAAAAVGPGGRADGIDPSEPMIHRARHLHRAIGCDFQLGNAEALPFDDATVDVVVSSFAVHHVPEAGRLLAIAEMHRVLRPGGRVLIAEFRPPRHRVPRNLLGLLSGHVMRDFPVDEPTELLRQTGFRITATDDLYPFTRYVTAQKPGDGQ